MSTAALAAALSIAGGLCELGGLALVVVGIARDRKQARRLFVKQRRRQRPQRTYPPRQWPRPSTPGSSYDMLRSQGEQLQRAIAGVEAGVVNALVAVRKAVDAELDATAERLERGMAEGDDHLREHLRYVLAGSIRGRAWGAALLALGIGLAAAGSALGAAA